MNFDEYEQAAAEFALYPEAGQGTKMGLAYCALGLTGESGEYSEKVKKYLRDGVFDSRLAFLELGDVLWYVTACARELGFSLKDVAETNLLKLLDRKERGKLQGAGMLDELKTLIIHKLDVLEFLDIIGYDLADLVERLDDELEENYSQLMDACS